MVLGLRHANVYRQSVNNLAPVEVETCRNRLDSSEYRRIHCRINRHFHHLGSACNFIRHSAVTQTAFSVSISFFLFFFITSGKNRLILTISMITTLQTTWP